MCPPTTPTPPPDDGLVHDAVAVDVVVAGLEVAHRSSASAESAMASRWADRIGFQRESRLRPVAIVVAAKIAFSGLCERVKWKR